MIQQQQYRFGPSLIQNGNFSEAASHWFGSYLRHVNVETQLPGTGLLAPTYALGMTGGQPNDYLPGILPGASQFIDLPELHSFPSQRTAEMLELRFVGGGLYLLTTTDGSTINGQPLVAGDPNALGSARFFQHPFRFKNEEVRTIQAGSTIQLSNTTYSAALTTGTLILEPGVIGENIANHSLQLSGTAEQDSIISSVELPQVVAGARGPNLTGAGLLLFTGPLHETFPTFQRPDGTQGLRIGDTLLLGDLAVRIIDVAAGVFVDPNTGVSSFNISYRNLLGAGPVLAARDFSEWSVHIPLVVDASFEMPLFRYDYTLSYLYNEAEGVQPDDAKIQFLASGIDSIDGLGAVVETMVPISSEDLNINFNSFEGSWRKRFHHLVSEFADPVPGRMMVNIPVPPGGVAPEANTLPVVSVSYTVSTNDFRANLMLPIQAGIQVLTGSFNGFAEVTIEVDAPVGSFTVGDTFFFAGFTNRTSADWMRSLIQEEGECTVTDITSISAGVTELVLTAPNFGDAADFNNTFSTSPIRLTEEPALVKELRIGDLVQLKTDPNLVNTWLEPLFEVPRSVTFTFLVDVSATTARAIIVMEWPLAPPIVTGLNLENTEIEIVRQIATSGAFISDVQLHKGFTYSTLHDTDDISSDESIDRFINHVNEESNVVPKGAVVLYAGGGACPAGYSAIQGFQGSDGDAGSLERAKEVEVSTPLTYRGPNNTTELTFPGQTFDQLDENGAPIPLDGSARFIQRSVPGVFDENGNQVFQTIEVLRTKQLIEPGMVLRGLFQTDPAAPAPTLINSSTGFDFDDFSAPYAHEDAGYIVTDVQPTIGGELDGVPVASARATRANQPFAQSGGFNNEFSTFGGGFGSVVYPSSVINMFNQQEYTDPGIGPAGPTFTEQKEDFPVPGSPFSYLTLVSRSDGEGFPSGSNNIYVATDFRNSNPFSGRTIQSVVVSENTNASETLEFTPGVLRDGDVYFATFYLDDGRVTNPANGPPNPDGYFDSWLCRLQKRSGAGWHIYRYDNRKIKLLGLGNVFNLGNNTEPFPSNVHHGEQNTLSNGLVVLRPAKLYGAPGQTQIIRTTPGITGTTPAGAGETYSQTLVTLPTSTGGEETVHFSRFTEIGTKITVLGNLLGNAPDKLLVEPSGYLRYAETPIKALDYGASGHVHSLAIEESIPLDRPVPKPDKSKNSEYQSTQLPKDHGHTLSGEVKYPLPLAKMFTICAKL